MMKYLTQIALLLYLLNGTCFAQTKLKKSVRNETKKAMSAQTKMKVDIWSDIMCPFCYIGKRHFESALLQFADSNNIELEWHSFQLDPNLPKPASKLSAYQYLAERKGMSLEESVAMHQNVIQMAKEAGLTYNYDKAVVANSFDAHRLIQFAKKHNLGDAVEERFFKAYFMEGKDMSDPTTLIALGREIGLDENEVTDVVNSTKYTDEVNADIQEAQQIGVTGVPFFVFDRKYAVSGAQPSTSFLNVLQKSFKEWNQKK